VKPTFLNGSLGLSAENDGFSNKLARANEVVIQDKLLMAIQPNHPYLEVGPHLSKWLVKAVSHL